jgi:hypothetical protein
MTLTILLLSALATTVPCLAIWLGDARRQSVRS